MKWMKPNGSEIETNDLKATIEYAKSMDWKPLDESDAPADDPPMANPDEVVQPGEGDGTLKGSDPA